ncbi:MAG: N-acetylmuramoyl-L-alanine amidase [Neisseriaceae bacterium]|nr:N-acetylmuramoyl-L-alanine amidase [Neisseriaceae bacterium]
MAHISRRKLMTSAAGTLLLSLVPVSAHSAEQAKFVAVRYWPANAYTRITLESSLPVQHAFSLEQNPQRVVLDIKNVKLQGVLESLPAKVLNRDPYVKKIRVAQHNAATVRIVLDLKTAVEPQIFTLAPVANFKNRLVVDLYPASVANEEDPLMALLQDYRRGDISTDGTNAHQTAQSDDILGDKIKDILAQDNQKNSPKQKGINHYQRKKRRIIVVLDPGHGGEDPGAVGATGLTEKSVVLSIARETRKLLEAKGYKVYMTRNEDVFIPLRVRVAKARSVKADIFVSIHADASPKTTARGTGVFALSQKGATSEAARYLANTQNAADSIGGVVEKVGNKMVDNTLFDLTQTATINDSLKLGKIVLNLLSKINKLHQGKVEQAAFAVLKAPDIPSILVETAFISNPIEEQKLAGQKFRTQCARAITEGIDTYFRQGAALRA